MIEKGTVKPGSRFDRDTTAEKVVANVNFVVNTMLRRQCRWDESGEQWLRSVMYWCDRRYGFPSEVAVALAMFDLEDPLYFLNMSGDRQAFSDPDSVGFKLKDLEDRAAALVETWLHANGMTARQVNNLHSDLSMALAIHGQSLKLARTYVRGTGDF